MKPLASYVLAGIAALMILVLAALAFGVVRRFEAPRHVMPLNEPPSLRVYAVPGDRAREIRDALDVVLSATHEKGAPLGRAMLSGGQLVVLAPRETQDTIADAVKQLVGKAPVAANAVTSMRLSLWMVDALPGAGADDPALAPIGAALQASRASLGEVRFALRDATALTALPNGDGVEIESPRHTHLNAQLRAGETGTSVDIGIRGPDATLRTTALLQTGQVIVLAQMLSPDKAVERTRLYVVRLDPVDAG